MNNAEIHPPFFIVGCTRSGTTLISRILDAHSKMAVYHESHFYHLLHHDLHRYGDLGRRANLRRLVADAIEIVRLQKKLRPPTEKEFLDALVAPTFEGVLATVLCLYARQQGKIRGGDKTPGHHTYLREIAKNFPQSRIIFVLRDPRDAVRAIREKFGASLGGAVSLWNQAFLSYQKFSGRVLLVRYEDLVQRPQEIVLSMCDHLGEGYEPGMLRFFENVPDWLAGIPYNQDLLGPVNAGYIGRFREMAPRDVERIEAACATGMEAMGYDFSRGKPKLQPIKPVGKVAFLIERLRFYHWNLGRWRRGWIRWKIVLRLRARYFLLFGWLRQNGAGS